MLCSESQKIMVKKKRHSALLGPRDSCTVDRHKGLRGVACPHPFEHQNLLSIVRARNYVLYMQKQHMIELLLLSKSAESAYLVENLV